MKRLADEALDTRLPQPSKNPRAVIGRALQDADPMHCFGCGALNERGLQIKSFWSGEEVVCAWRGQPFHIGHPGYLYGGVLACVVDCHCIWTAVAYAHRQAGTEPGADSITYVTASLKIDYRKPLPIARPIELRARVAEFGERKALVRCTVFCDGVACAEAEVIAVRVTAQWSATKN